MFKKKFIGICGSLRKNSRNMGLLRAAAEAMPEGASLEIADITNIPLYREDMTKPDSVEHLARQVREADGIVLAVAEYNYSYAPALKNALDWLSREKGELLAGKTCAMMGAAGGMGSSRAQYHLRQVCVYLDLRVLNKPEVFANAFSDAFAADGSASDSESGAQLRANVASLMQVLCARV
ncbi:NADPH-dependent FMN reductase [Mailhella sp.]|uniref:NADPH-dependent FMN reductase n=1 Tax=Mailhella sp. TaxID=1981029 RepID=UPI0040640433